LYSLVPAATGGNIDRRPTSIVLEFEVDDAAARLADVVDEQPQHGQLAALDGLHDAVPAAVHAVHVGALLEQQVEHVHVPVALVAPHRLDQRQVLAGRVDVGPRVLDQEPHHVLVALADRRGQGREDAAAPVLDAHARLEQQLDALELVRHDRHLQHAPEGARVAQYPEQLLQDVRVPDRHVHRPPLAAHAGVRAAAKQRVHHVGLVLPDGSRQRRAALGAAVVGPRQRVRVADRHGRLADAWGRRKVTASLDQPGEVVLCAEVRHALEAGVLCRRQVGVCPRGQHHVEKILAVVADRRAQRRPHAILAGVDVDAGREQDADGVGVVDGRGQLQHAGGLFGVCAARQEDLEAGGLGGGWPQHVLWPREVWRRDHVDPAAVGDGLEEGGLALAALGVGVCAVLEQQLHQPERGVAAADRRDERSVALGELQVDIGAVGEQQLGQLRALLGDGYAQGQPRAGDVGAREVWVGAVFEEQLRPLEEGDLDGVQEWGDTVRVGRVGIRTEAEQQTDSLEVAIEYRFPEDVDVVGVRVGGDAAVEELLDDLVLLGLDGTGKGSPQVGIVGGGDVSWLPAGHLLGVGADSNGLDGTAQVQAFQIVEQRVCVCQAWRGTVVLYQRPRMVRIAFEAEVQLWCRPAVLLADLFKRPRLFEVGGGSAPSHAVQGSSQAYVARAGGIIRRHAAQGPLEHEGAHPQGIPRLAEGVPHARDGLVGKHHAPALAKLAAHAAVLVAQELAHHLVQDDKVGVCLLELCVELLDHVLGEVLAGAEALGQPGLDGPEDPAYVEKVLGQVLEAKGWVLDGAEEVEHPHGYGVALQSCLCAKLEQSMSARVFHHGDVCAAGSVNKVPVL
ncbi:hypothetical protein PspLS_04117, partial [Pyricularia sp. CBS 133598]